MSLADLHSLLVSNELEKEFAELVGIPVHLLVEQHYHVLTEIVMALNSHILKVILGEQFPSSSVKDHGRDVSKMTEESKGKIRYCGAWAIAKARNACRVLQDKHLFSTC